MNEPESWIVMAAGPAAPTQRQPLLPVDREPVPARSTLPALAENPPHVLDPVRVNVPLPFMFRLPLPLMPPWMVVLPDPAIVKRLPPLMTLPRIVRSAG